MIWSCEFFVVGIPQPKGNHRASVVGGKRAHLYDANPKLPSWERAVRYAAMPLRPPTPLEGPVSAELVFWLPRPKSVKRAWPTAKGKGDIDKLVRAVLDGMTGVIYLDDAQVVMETSSKNYETRARGPGCLVTVSAMGEEDGGGGGHHIGMR